MFLAGDIVFYPVYGAGCVDEIKTETVCGKSYDYYVIKLLSGIDMMIPTNSDKLKKIRKAITESQCQEILDILQKKSHKLPKKWGERFKVYNNSIREGDIYKMAEVLRDISDMAKKRELSKSDIKAFDELLYMISGEISLVLGVDIKDISSEITSIIHFEDRCV